MRRRPPAENDRSRLPGSFWRLWAATTSSNIGDGVVLAALPLLAADLTRSPLTIALMTVAIRLPWLVFGLFAGVIVDRSDHRRLMILADTLRAAAFAGLALLVLAGDATLIALYATVFLVGVLETLFDTAAMSALPDLVVSAELERANSRLNGAHLTANAFVGPPLGGLLFALGAAVPLAFDAVSFLVSALVIIPLATPRRLAPAEERSLASNLRAGFRAVWNEPIIRGFAIGAGVLNLGFTAGAFVLVLHAQDHLGLSPTGFGLLLGAGAIGGVAGTQIAPMVIRRAGRYRAVLGAVVAMAVLLLVVGLASVAWVAGVAFAGFAVAEEVWNIVSVTYRQRATRHGTRSA